ncbi:MAG: hypothetical protein NXI24_21200 [bacterium]|nr:hypothetical protein [bacterium]
MIALAIYVYLGAPLQSGPVSEAENREFAQALRDLGATSGSYVSANNRGTKLIPVFAAAASNAPEVGTLVAAFALGGAAQAFTSSTLGSGTGGYENDF